MTFCCVSILSWMKSADVNANANSQYEDGEDDKENECVQDHSLAIGGNAAKFDMPDIPR